MVSSTFPALLLIRRLALLALSVKQREEAKVGNGGDGENRPRILRQSPRGPKTFLGADFAGFCHGRSLTGLFSLRLRLAPDQLSTTTLDSSALHVADAASAALYLTMPTRVFDLPLDGMSRFDFSTPSTSTPRAGLFQSWDASPDRGATDGPGRSSEDASPAYDASFSLPTREATRDDEKGSCSTVELLGWEVSVASQFSSPVCSVIYSFQIFGDGVTRLGWGFLS